MEIHKLFFRFLKENGLFGTINVKKICKKKMLPENYVSCCTISKVSQKRQLKKEWLKFIEPYLKELWKTAYKKYLGDLSRNEKNALQKFLEYRHISIAKIIKSLPLEGFKSDFILSSHNIRYNNYSYDILLIDERWYKNAKKYFFQELK